MKMQSDDESQPNYDYDEVTIHSTIRALKAARNQTPDTAHMTEHAKKGLRSSELARKKMPTPAQLEKADRLGRAFLDGLNKGVKKSVLRTKRWEKIYAIEKSTWPHNMGSLQRDEIPEELHSLLDECITRSQEIAQTACQTPELTEAYLKGM